MKKSLVITAFLVVIVLMYFVFKIDKNRNDEILDNQHATYTSEDVGLSFDYKTGPKGYVLEERLPVDLGTGLVKNILLQRTEDTLRPIPEGGEVSPMIVISIFENPKKQFAGVWADKNTQYSNINLKQGEIKEVVVGGANAIRYIADGLYTSDNTVVAHGDSIYVFSGQFLDKDSSIYSDFNSLIESVKFIPKVKQQ